MEVSNPIYMAPKMTVLTKIIILNIHFGLFCLMKLDGAIQCFHLESKTLVNGVQDMSQKIIHQGYLIRFAGNAHVYQTLESSWFISAGATGTHKAQFNLLICLLRNIFEIII